MQKSHSLLLQTIALSLFSKDLGVIGASAAEEKERFYALVLARKEKEKRGEESEEKEEGRARVYHDWQTHMVPIPEEAIDFFKSIESIKSIEGDRVDLLSSVAYEEESRLPIFYFIQDKGFDWLVRNTVRKATLSPEEKWEKIVAHLEIKRYEEWQEEIIPKERIKMITSEYRGERRRKKGRVQNWKKITFYAEDIACALESMKKRVRPKKTLPTVTEEIGTKIKEDRGAVLKGIKSKKIAKLS